METENRYTELLEQSLSRVWKHATDKNTSFALLTAFRGEFSRKENLQRNKVLAAKIKNMGYGYFFLDGFWVETGDDGKQTHVSEDSLFVIARSNDNQFVKRMHELGNAYNQDAILVKDDQGFRLIFKNGSTEKLNTLRPGAIGSMYSKLRGKKNSTFIFESERDDIGWLARLKKQSLDN